MKINVGSMNAVKNAAVREVLAQYPFLKGAVIKGVSVSSGVSENPLTLDETIRGAKGRAEAAFDGCDFSIGIEAGIWPVPHTITGYMSVEVCSVYDGTDHFLGLSSGFEYPRDVTAVVLEGEHDLSQAYRMLGLTEHEKIGEHEGIIGQLTKGRIDRKEYMRHAIIHALIYVEKKYGMKTEAEDGPGA
ncbi:inosine/xanthosine triphosphatase [Candidatus Woesearchaeota archaeon]|nr:inosine/xanthosine triphosphatase [Candidatus Woesearchaeota archaeon]